MARPLKPFTVSTGALRTQVKEAWLSSQHRMVRAPGMPGSMAEHRPLQGVLFCIIAAIVASVLPVLSYIFVSLPRVYPGLRCSTASCLPAARQPGPHLC